MTAYLVFRSMGQQTATVLYTAPGIAESCMYAQLTTAGTKACDTMQAVLHPVKALPVGGDSAETTRQPKPIGSHLVTNTVLFAQSLHGAVKGF
jgi:hypothetical protein